MVTPPPPARAAMRARSNVAADIAAATSPTARAASANIGRDDRLQVVLGIDDVAEGRVVGRDQDGLRLSDGQAGQAARVLERDRVALLRHDAARLDEAVGEAQVADFGCAPEQQVLHDSSEPDRA